MGKVYDGIDDGLRAFLLRQPVYFVATAPSGPDGHVNVSPKGMGGTFAVLGPHRVAYADFTGSGAETIAHLRDNGRITLMFCAFDGPPKIVRLHGRGAAVWPGGAGFDGVRAAFPDLPDDHGLRSVVVVDVDRVSDSCGFAVPLMAYEGDRPLLLQWAERRSDDDLADYRRDRNARSIDDLPALTPTEAGAR
jgi:hypothetical protein